MIQFCHTFLNGRKMDRGVQPGIFSQLDRGHRSRTRLLLSNSNPGENEPPNPETDRRRPEIARNTKRRMPLNSGCQYEHAAEGSGETGKTIAR
jgi:hypothetical protein